MRLFINGLLAFALVGLVAGLVPVASQHLARLRAVKTELAVAEAARHVKLRGSIYE